jgi:hypothetical protein
MARKRKVAVLRYYSDPDTSDEDLTERVQAIRFSSQNGHISSTATYFTAPVSPKKGRAVATSNEQEFITEPTLEVPIDTEGLDPDYLAFVEENEGPQGHRQAGRNSVCD